MLLILFWLLIGWFVLCVYFAPHGQGPDCDLICQICPGSSS